MEGDRVQTTGTAWIICSSKSQNGRRYYFNTQTGEATWNLSETEMAKAALDLGSYPEPSEPPADRHREFSFSSMSQIPSTSAQIYNEQVINNQHQFQLPSLIVPGFNVLQNMVTNPINQIFQIPLNASNSTFGTNVWAVPPPIFLSHTHFANQGEPHLQTLNVPFPNQVHQVPRVSVQNHDVSRRKTSFVSHKNIQKSFSPRKGRTRLVKLDLRRLLTTRRLQRRMSQTKEHGDCVNRSDSSEEHEDSRPVEINPAWIKQDEQEMVEKANADTDWLENNFIVNKGKLRLDLSNLKKLASPNHNLQKWYIVVDTLIFLKHLNFLNILCNSDDDCCLMVPQKVLAELQALQGGTAPRLASRAKRAEMFLLKHSNGDNVVIGDANFEETDSRAVYLIRCCENLLEQNHHVVLFSDDCEIKNIDTSVRVFNMEELKQVLTLPETDDKKKYRLPPPGWISKPIKITVPNDQSILAKEKYKDTPNEDVSKRNKEIIPDIRSLSRTSDYCSNDISEPGYKESQAPDNILNNNNTQKGISLTNDEESQALDNILNKIQASQKTVSQSNDTERVSLGKAASTTTTHKKIVKKEIRLIRNISVKPLSSAEQTQGNQEKKKYRWRKKRLTREPLLVQDSCGSCSNDVQLCSTDMFRENENKDVPREKQPSYIVDMVDEDRNVPREKEPSYIVNKNRNVPREKEPSYIVDENRNVPREKEPSYIVDENRNVPREKETSYDDDDDENRIVPLKKEPSYIVDEKKGVLRHELSKNTNNSERQPNKFFVSDGSIRKSQNTSKVLIEKTLPSKVNTTSETKDLPAENIVVKDLEMKLSFQVMKDEWLPRFSQIMEEILSQILRLDQQFRGRGPWTIVEAAGCLKIMFRNHVDVLDAANKLSKTLSDITFSSGNYVHYCRDLKESQFIELFMSGVKLVEALGTVVNDCEDLLLASDSLSQLFKEMNNSDLGNFGDLNHIVSSPSDSLYVHTPSVITPIKSPTKRNTSEQVVYQGLPKIATTENKTSCNRRILRSTFKTSVKSPQKKDQQNTERQIKFIRTVNMKDSFFSNLNLIKKTPTSDCNTLDISETNTANSQNITKNISDTRNTENSEVKVVRQFAICPEIEKKLKDKKIIPAISESTAKANTANDQNITKSTPDTRRLKNSEVKVIRQFAFCPEMENKIEDERMIPVTRESHAQKENSQMIIKSIFGTPSSDNNEVEDGQSLPVPKEHIYNAKSQNITKSIFDTPSSEHNEEEYEKGIPVTSEHISITPTCTQNSKVKVVRQFTFRPEIERKLENKKNIPVTRKSLDMDYLDYSGYFENGVGEDDDDNFNYQKPKVITLADTITNTFLSENNAGNFEDNSSLNLNYTLNCIFFKVINDAKKAIIEIQKFCERTIQELSGSVCTEDRRCELYAEAINTQVLIDRLCDSLSSIYCREMHTEGNIESILMKAGINDFDFDNKIVDHYMDAIGSCLQKAKILQEAASLLVYAINQRLTS